MPAITNILILLLLDNQSVIRAARYCNQQSSDYFQESLAPYEGLKLEQIPNTQWNYADQSVYWKGAYFYFDLFRISPSTRGLLLKQENRREQLMELALEQMTDGVQLWDENAVIQFFNRSSKQLLGVPANREIEGHHLLEYFAVTDENSTTLTALRTRKALRGCLHSYKSLTGKELHTVNDATPVLSNGRLLGCVSFERDIRIAKTMVNQWLDIQKTLVRDMPLVAEPKDAHYTFRDLIGHNPKLTDMVNLAAKMATRDLNILIQGETGTGKEIIAQGIHQLSARCRENFVAINCAAVPETLIEGVLFGTSKGAFTGSIDRAGVIENANHGTLFLDEINSMSPAMQAKLLRVLQEKKVSRVGSNHSIQVDIRILSACNENVHALIKQGKMRSDLFYRISSVILEIPPLRERLDDLEELTLYYLEQHQTSVGPDITRITPDFWERLRQHDWPGNVRELFHILSYAVNVCDDGVLKESDLPPYFLNLNPPTPTPSPPSGGALNLEPGLSELMQAYQRGVLQEAYAACEGNVTKMAAILKISRQNCQHYIKKYGLK